ncbi:WD repeat-containing protein 25 [Rhinichthys klamathensis goyatoka]|uniref:WD repeat-containing protein 25 n=1 Tax=Rhinichthys klamathensis goyatoka TaxID=3034132 RepID=UPI0024B4F15E|nr:WD repeat-containing protein 25 [Rhinichthys klamathensis goyatoka]XP_056092710.1 WD repeat-containing protein 25 [Rhinichthys klamathensis goyatoka]XP_056092711.1 WD repeat-containing protein 25 [Rhinichthys klamathensis goyatoka]
MASLVDYEDSDSDSDQDLQSAAPHPHLELYKDQSLIMSSSLSSSSSSVVSVSGCRKRAQPQPAGVRPYVPKRERVSTAAAQTPETPHTPHTPPPAGARLLSEVSERVRPFLALKPGRVELPRRVQCLIQAHQGPVNTLQWSPVDHLSHLLLSASMDNTCKVWDGVGGGRSLRTYSAHRGAVRDACWLPCGRRLLSGSFDGTAALTDAETGQTVAQMDNGFKVTCVAPQPSAPDVFLSGGFSSEVKAWDTRCRKVLRVYKAAVQQTLDVLFLSGGREFVSSTDAVSRDSAERTLIAWDFQTTAKLSNQIFHERYTCPSLSAHPLDASFIAQTNGGYIALFSAQRPYRMNKRRRYEGHKVEGFAVHCGFSADGSVLVSGSSTGSVHFYDYQSSRSLKTLDAHEHACVCAALHPVLPAVTATCDWTGEIKIWT